MTAPDLLVIGVGNPDCGDDGIGPMVADLLADLLPPGVTLLRRSGDMLAMLDDWAGHAGVVLIDAATSMGKPGTWHRIDLLRDTLPSGLALASTHAFGVAQAVALAGALGRIPGQLVVYAVEGIDFIPGAAMDPAVKSAAPVIAQRVLAEVLDMRNALP